MQLELRRRIVSAVVMAVVVLAATVAGGIAFRLVAAAIALLIFYEWSSMVAARAAPGLATPPAGPAGAFPASWVIVAVGASAILAGFTPWAMAAIGAGAAVIALWARLSGGSLWLATGIVYSGLPAAALAEIRGTDTAGLIAVLFLFAIVWATDIAAYFTGRALGGPKLAPRISPSKTWSGALGGAFAGAACGTVVLAVTQPGVAAVASAVALVLAVASEIGDLFESFVKRRFGVKDSGRLIPGHGGVMDRVDGLVFAAFAAYLLAQVAAFQFYPENAAGREAAAIFGITGP